MPKHGRLRGQGKAQIRCIAGRTPLDDPAAMLAQLLRKASLLKLLCGILHLCASKNSLLV